jgi:membrane-associated phospholipid phosphatase
VLDGWPIPFANALAVSDFADQALILPLAIGIGLLLAVSGWRRGALAWAAAIGGTLLLILLLKLRYFACGHIFDEATRGNPSGHTAAAASVYGGLAGLIVASLWDDRRLALGAALVGAFLSSAIVGQSRLLLDRHTLAEVLWGGMIGMAGAAAFVVFAGSPARVMRIGRILVAGIIGIALLHGFRMSAETTIQSVAFHLWPFSQCM